MESNTTVKDKVILMVVFFWLLGATIIAVSKLASPLSLTIRLQSSSHESVNSIVRTQAINFVHSEKEGDGK